MKHSLLCFTLLAVGLSGAFARAGTVTGTYFDLAEGTLIDLTADGTLDWVKFGNGENNNTTFLNTTKIGNPVFLPGTLSPLGTPPVDHVVQLIAFTGQGILNFTWTDGNFGMFNGGGPVDTVVTETITPAVDAYPIGLGASFQALAAAQTRVLDVYVQGFNADMLITAALSGGATTSTVVSPSHVPISDEGNDYSIGRYHIEYSGLGETLTISVLTQDPRTDGNQAAFANAGFFAATVTEIVPEPSAMMLALIGLTSLGMVARHRRKMT
jgi:hypothetical protein